MSVLCIHDHNITENKRQIFDGFPISDILVASLSDRIGLDQRSYYTLGPVSTGMRDCVWAGKPPRFVTRHSGQLSLLPSAGRKMSAAQMQ